MFQLLLISIAILSAVATDDLDQARQLWKLYTDSIGSQFGAELQANCTPSLMECIPSSEYPCKGVVMAWHGFLGCPDHFLEIAQIVQRRGYTVFLPLLPGHGLKYSVDSKGVQHDNFSKLPSHPKDYMNFLTQMNEIMKAVPKSYIRIAAGLSLGGATAAGAALSLDDNGELIYDRAISISPFFVTHSGLFADDLGDLIQRIPSIGNIVDSFGKDCLIQRERGAACYCSFQLKHIAAAFEYANSFYEQVSGSHKTIQKVSPSQFIYDVSDDTIDVSYVLKYQKALSNIQDQTSVCSLDVDQHSMIATADRPFLKKWWMNELDCKISSYILQEDIDYGSDFAPVNGLQFIEQSQNTDKWGGQYCQFDCDSVSCSYHYPNPVICPYTRPYTA